MSLYITSLNSGSNANCYYAGNGSEAVLIDAGLSCRETVRRMKRLGLDMQKVKAIFISHEHSDHINGLERLHRTFQLPVYCTAKTLRNSNLFLQKDLVFDFEKNKPVQIGSLKILPFSKSHDADDPHSFMISSENTSVGVITDIGYACEQVINCFLQCHAVFLEANYCEEMLAGGNYPIYLKRRISSDVGHLSNTQALEVFLKYRSERLQLLILSHLSKNNNTPEKVEELFKQHAGDVRIVVASRYEETQLFQIKGTENIQPVILHEPGKKMQPAPVKYLQGTLW